MLELNNVSFGYGGDKIFDKVTLKILPGDKIGLIGINGSGKSTLFKLLTGAIKPTAGKIEKQNNLRIGLLSQDLEMPLDKSIIDYTRTANQELLDLRHRVEEIYTQMETQSSEDRIMQLSNDVHELESQLQMQEAGQEEGKAQAILTGLGFDPNIVDRKLEVFSGGWRMRAGLARLLLMQPDILLLDEPTNHLDIESLLWMESWIKDYSGSVISIAHDKQFIDNTAKRIWDVYNYKIRDFKGNLTKFRTFEAEEFERMSAAQENQAKKIDQWQKMVDKFRAKKSKASTASSIQKMIDREDVIDVQARKTMSMNVKWPEFHPGGRVVTKSDHINHYYKEGEWVLRDVSFELERGDIVAFVGKNGQGKSTLAKIITKNLIPTNGDTQIGYNIDPYYFDQYQAESLDGSMTVLDTLEKSGSKLTTGEIRSLLGAFLFSGDDVDKKVKVLSGGERNRLALAKMILSRSNFLVLDEPTNHLDMESREVLKHALTMYKGTCILVSHDREFLKGLTQKTYYFENKKITEYLGDIEYVLEKRGVGDMRALEQKEIKEPVKVKVQLDNAERRALQKKVRNIENKIARTESKKDDISLQMSNPDFYKDPNAQSVMDELSEIKSTIEKLYEEWEVVSSQLE